MRVLFATHNFPRFSGDLPGNFLLRFAIALRAKDVEVEVVCPHGPDLAEADTVDGIKVTRFRYAPEARETLAYGGTMAAQVRASWRAKADLVALIRAGSRAIRARAGSVNIVHAHWWFPLGLAATNRARGATPLVTTMHGSDVRLARGVIGGMLMRRVLARSARTTAVSTWLATEAQKRSGVAGTVVARMPVDAQLFNPSRMTRSGLLFVGKLDEQKGARVLIDSLPHLDASVNATIIGGGPLESALRAHAARIGVASRVNWLGPIAQRDLPQHYQRAQLFIAPVTEPEGLGLTSVESLLCETPVIASHLGGLSDVVDDGISGRLIPPNDPRILADAIRSALADQPQLGTWGREGRERVLHRFDSDVCAARYRALYDEVLSGHAA